MTRRGASVIWAALGVPLCGLLGWLLVKPSAVNLIERGQTLGEDLGPEGAILDIFGGLGAAVVAAPLLLLGPLVGVVLGLIVFRAIRRPGLAERATAFFRGPPDRP